MASQHEVQTLVNACVECVRRGSNEAQRWMDNWLAQHEGHVWPSLMAAIGQYEMNDEVKYFLFVCVCRRLRLFGTPSHAVNISDIIELVESQIEGVAENGQMQSP